MSTIDNVPIVVAGGGAGGINPPESLQCSLRKEGGQSSEAGGHCIWLDERASGASGARYRGTVGGYGAQAPRPGQASGRYIQICYQYFLLGGGLIFDTTSTFCQEAKYAKHSGPSVSAHRSVANLRHSKRSYQVVISNDKTP